MNIYVEAIKQVKSGARFRIDLQNRTLKVNHKQLIKNGEFKGDLGFGKDEQPLISITHLFNRYQHSLPSERSEKQSRRYFNPLPYESLSDDDIIYGEQREVAQFKLEYYLLAMILNGSLKWDEFAEGKWFWQSPENKALVIMKEWVAN